MGSDPKEVGGGAVIFLAVIFVILIIGAISKMGNEDSDNPTIPTNGTITNGTTVNQTDITPKMPTLKTKLSKVTLLYNNTNVKN